MERGKLPDSSNYVYPSGEEGRSSGAQEPEFSSTQKKEGLLVWGRDDRRRRAKRSHPKTKNAINLYQTATLPLDKRGKYTFLSRLFGCKKGGETHPSLYTHRTEKQCSKRGENRRLSEVPSLFSFSGKEVSKISRGGEKTRISRSREAPSLPAARKV